jgi:Flp pilus assembly protein TadD
MKTDLQTHVPADPCEATLAAWIDRGQELDLGPTTEPGTADAKAMASSALRQLLESERVARRGDLTSAESHLRSAEKLLAELPEHSVLRREVEARFSIVFARRAFRAGEALQLKAHLRRAQAQLDAMTPPPRTLRLALVELQADVAASNGQYERATRTLRQAEALAREEGLLWVARFHRMLGAIHARCGRPLLAANAYHAAAAAVSVDDAPLEFAKICSNLAMVSLMAGELGAARTSIERALALRREHHAPIAEIANSTAVLALVSDREERDDAAALWAEAVRLSGQSPEDVLTAEIELRASIAAARRGDHALGRELLESATMRSTAMGRIHPTIGAMATEARARLHLCRSEFEEARTEARRAHQAYVTIDLVYHVARVEFLLGQVEFKLGNVPSSCQWFESACRRALKGNFELGVRSFEEAALRGAAARGEPAVRRYCRQHELAPDDEGGVLLLDRAGAIDAFGKRHEIGRHAIPYRIVRALCVAIPAGVTLPSLCKRLWPEEGFNARTANRLRVHIHRLRELLGSEHPCVLTKTVTRGGESVTRYIWNREVSIRLVRGL